MLAYIVLVRFTQENSLHSNTGQTLNCDIIEMHIQLELHFTVFIRFSSKSIYPTKECKECVFLCVTVNG